MNGPPKEVIDFLRSIPVPYLSDALTQHGILNTRMWGILPLTPFENPNKHIAGPALTMRFLPAYSIAAVYKSPYKHTEFIEEAPPGSVIVIEGRGGVCLGERSCRTGVRSGLEAVVGDGPVRDVDGVKAARLPVFVPGGGGLYGIKMESYVSVPLECVGYNMPIYCGAPGRPGAQVRPGDLVVGDNNGVVVLPLEYLDALLETAKDIAKLEEDMQQMIDKGESWKEIYPTVHARKYGAEEPDSSP